MSYCLYEVDKEKRIARLTFNRPEKLHATKPADTEEVIQRLMEAERDDNVAVVIMKGSGSCFGAGYDIDAVREKRGFHESCALLR